MARSTEILHILKRATNYTKLAMHKEGPRSFKEGVGALIKVLYKFGDGNAMTMKALKKELHWRSHELVHVTEKAEENGYCFYVIDPEGKLAVSLTDKGVEVIQKRMAAEDRAADSVLDGLSDDERTAIIAICEKIIANCEAMGVDYSEIYVKKGHGKSSKKSRHGSERRSSRDEDVDVEEIDAVEVDEVEE